MKLDELKELLEIDLTSLSGLRWVKYRAGNARKGDIAGSLRSDGYYQTRVLGKVILNHRAIYAIYHNLEPDQIPKEIDHIDRDSKNNNPLNLRPATKSQNQANTLANTTNTSGIKGVSWHPQRKKWRSQIRVNGKIKHLGLFSNKEDAKKAYEEEHIKIYNEYSYVKYNPLY